MCTRFEMRVSRLPEGHMRKLISQFQSREPFSDKEAKKFLLMKATKICLGNLWRQVLNDLRNSSKYINEN